MKKKNESKKIITSSVDGTKVEITNIEGTGLAIWKGI